MWSLISWLCQKPADLDLQCFCQKPADLHLQFFKEGCIRSAGQGLWNIEQNIHTSHPLNVTNYHDGTLVFIYFKLACYGRVFANMYWCAHLMGNP